MTFSVIASLDDDSTLNLCVSVLVDAEFVTGAIQQVVVALAIAELHIGAAGNTPVGNLTDGMSPKKIPEVYSSASEALTLTVLMASLTPLRPKTDQPSIWDTESPDSIPYPRFRFADGRCSNPPGRAACRARSTEKSIWGTRGPTQAGRSSPSGRRGARSRRLHSTAAA